MKNISGKYEIKGKSVGFNVDIPSSWEELDRYQFATIIQVLNFRKADPYTISVSLLSLLFGQKNFHILSGLPEEYLYELVPLTNFILEDKPPLKNFFPEINLNKKKHISPDPDLSNLGFGEWCFAFEFYNYYQLTTDIKWLNKLIAVIYRPIDPNEDEDSPKFTGDLRERFNENLIAKREKAVQSLEERIRLAILSWFSVALSHVTADRPNVFPTPREGEETPVSPTPDSRTWMSVFRDLLGPKWGTTEELKNTNAMFILDELEERQIEYDKAAKSK